MFMSVVTRDPGTEVYPELAGSRVVITGLTSTLGVDVARAFADRKAALIVQSPEVSPEVTELAALLAASASDMKLFNTDFAASQDAVRFAQTAAQSFGGIDTVINLISISAAECDDVSTEQDLEDLVAEKLSAATHITQVASNRMRLTWTEGQILNVLVMPAPQSPQIAAVAGYARAALAALTRLAAQQWAGEAVRINAIGPKATSFDAHSGACLTSEPDLAALALYLASRKGRTLTGHVFDAEGIASRRC
jgi:NAD(P)-dependent dehydrogenase (short-subunit alcohol dehydrogenase family)